MRKGPSTYDPHWAEGVGQAPPGGVWVGFVLRVDFLLKTDSGYPRDTEVTLFTLALVPGYTTLPVRVRANI